jgi:itaconate CoA-transferase
VIRPGQRRIGVPRGKSITSCRSTRGGIVSRIVPTLQRPVTMPRNDTHLILTENGWLT